MRVDEEGMEEENEGDQHPPQLMSPPTFQPWLRLSIDRCVSLVIDRCLFGTRLSAMQRDRKFTYL